MSGKRYPEEFKLKLLNRLLTAAIPLQASPPVLISPRTAFTPG